MSISNNTIQLQNILEVVNTLPKLKDEPILQDKVIMPTASQQNITADQGYDGLGSVTVEGDENLVADNIKSGISIFGVNGALEDGSRGSDIENAIISRTISVYENDRATSIRNYAFYDCSSLASVSFPVCTSIGIYAFCNCSSLTSVSFPACTSIGNSAFSNCSSLTSVNFPSCATISTYAFRNCSSLTSVSFPACTSMGIYAFYSCSSLTSVSFPVCKIIGAYAFEKCSSLTSVNFPSCATISSYAFSNCSSLASVSFPKCTNIGGYAFAYCSSLTSVSFPVCTYIDSSVFFYCQYLNTASFPVCSKINNSAFYKCYNLISLYLTGSSRCILSASSAFTSTPIGGYSTSAGRYGSIYVPQSLLASYQTATNWTYFSSRFVAYDAGTDGGNSGEIIEFTIAETSYRAEEGMTWAEWVNSDYNTGGFFVKSNGSVSNDNSSAITYENSNGLITYSEENDVIISNELYSLSVDFN